VPSLIHSACIAAFVTGGLAFAATIDGSNQYPDPTDASSSMEGSGDPGIIVNGYSQSGMSNQDLPQLTLFSVQTDAVPRVPEPSTVALISGAVCVTLVGRRKLARR